MTERPDLKGQQSLMPNPDSDSSSCFHLCIENYYIALWKLSRKEFCDVLGYLEQKDGTFLLLGERLLKENARKKEAF